MFNLTHDDSSAVDIGGIWTGPDEFELTFRLNHDDEDDLVIHLILNKYLKIISLIIKLYIKKNLN